MINLALGSSGSGKSYEACVYHILEAVKKGRLVITNMPLRLETWEALDTSFPGLLERRTKPQPIRGSWEPTREEGAFNVWNEDAWQQPEPMARAFAGVWDYFTTWRHPETNIGPLFVIDEAQNVIPAKGTSQAVEEWTALHRHWMCDVLYLTQSYGKLNKAIRENVQMVYRFRKKVAWGQPDKYIRKVQDGVRGEVLNEGERSYESRYFSLYRSHTQGTAGKEAMADDIRPWWKHWSFVGAAIMLSIGAAIVIFSDSVNPLKSPAHKANGSQVKPVRVVEEVNGKVVSDTGLAPATLPTQRKKDELVKDFDSPHPYAGRGLHIVGSVQNLKRIRYVFSVSQNGQEVSQVDSLDLASLGYKVGSQTPCAVTVEWEGVTRWIICDAPRVTVSNASRQENEQRAGGAREAGGPGDAARVSDVEPIHINPQQLHTPSGGYAGA